MKVLLYTTLIMAALVAGVLLGRSGALDLGGALILVVGGAIGAAVLYPHAFPKRH